MIGDKMNISTNVSLTLSGSELSKKSIGDALPQIVFILLLNADLDITWNFMGTSHFQVCLTDITSTAPRLET